MWLILMCFYSYLCFDLFCFIIYHYLPHDMYGNTSQTCCILLVAEKGLLGGGGWHSGPLCDWRLPGKRQEDGHLWGLLAGLLRRRQWGVPVRLQGMCLYRTCFKYMKEKNFLVHSSWILKNTKVYNLNNFNFLSSSFPCYGWKNQIMQLQEIIKQVHIGYSCNQQKKCWDAKYCELVWMLNISLLCIWKERKWRNKNYCLQWYLPQESWTNG